MASDAHSGGSRDVNDDDLSAVEVIASLGTRRTRSLVVTRHVTFDACHRCGSRGGRGCG